jgi:hypothetical protein
MIRITALRTAAFSLSFLLLVFAPAHAQATPAAPPEAPSPLSAIATWLNHLGDAGTPPHRGSPSSTPLPRPRPAELGPAPVSPKKLAPVLIND